mmetsp:Transcript_14486/g.31518  ORF Transcript_14486/g.31518 Transcript_14486/m.31518 type:complete len:211 (+) Transcript_14486:296-928(+)
MRSATTLSSSPRPLRKAANPSSSTKWMAVNARILSTFVSMYCLVLIVLTELLKLSQQSKEGQNKAPGFDCEEGIQEATQTCCWHSGFINLATGTSTSMMASALAFTPSLMTLSLHWSPSPPCHPCLDCSPSLPYPPFPLRRHNISNRGSVILGYKTKKITTQMHFLPLPPCRVHNNRFPPMPSPPPFLPHGDIIHDGGKTTKMLASALAS